MVASDRGQVLLLGGLAIAIVFLTAIPLSNSLVVSESASSSQTVDDIDRAESREASAERGLRTVLAGVDTSDTDAVNESLRAFSTYYTNVSGQQDGVYVNASLNLSESGRSYGRDSLQNPGPGDNPWEPVSSSSQISTFNITIAGTATGNRAFTAEITDSSGTVVYELEASKSGSGVQVSTNNGTSSQSCSSSSVTIDLISGTCYTDTSTVPVASFSPADDTYDVEFQQPGNRGISGEFIIVGSGNFYGTPSVANPAIDLTFVGPQVSYTKTIRVDESS